MMNNIEKQHHHTLEELKQIDKDGNEFWYARSLAKLLGYADFRNFLKVIEKAKQACANSNYEISDHLVETTEVVKGGSGVSNPYPSFKLSRYACYLVVQNANPSKPVVETTLDFAIFQNHGYKGLYGGLDAKAIHVKKGLKKSHKILDYMGSTELAANLFRATQAEEKLKRDNVKSKIQANQTHHEVGKKVRQTIKELGGEMPEDLPAPQKSVLKIEKEQNKLEDKDGE